MDVRCSRASRKHKVLGKTERTSARDGGCSDVMDIPIDGLARVLLRSGQTLGASGLYSSVLLMILDAGRPLPADDRRAAKMLRMDVRAYRSALAECIADGSLERREAGEVWAPLADSCRPARVRADRISRRQIPSAQREAVLAKTGGRCAYCAVELVLEAGTPSSFQPDHVLPVVLGGTDDIANLIPSCRSCNSKKRAKTALQFLSGGAA